MLFDTWAFCRIDIRHRKFMLIKKKTHEILFFFEVVKFSNVKLSSNFF